MRGRREFNFVIAPLLRRKESLLRFIRSDGFKKYFENTSWLLVDNIATLAIGLVVSIFIARYLGPGDFGLLNFAKGIARFFTVTCGLGLERIVIRNLLYHKDNQAYILGTSLGLKITASVALTCLFALIGYFVLDTLAFWMSLFMIMVTMFESFVVVRYYFASRVEARFISRVVLVKIIISSLIKACLIYFEAPVLYFAIEVLFESLLSMAGYMYVYRSRAELPLRAWRFSMKHGETLLRDAWPLLLSGLIVFVYTETDIIMIRYLLNNEAVGHYSIAVRMTTIWYLGGTVICNSLFPAILNAKKMSEEVYHQRLIHLFRLLCVMALIIALFITFAGEPIILLLFGIQYAPGIPSLMILAWSLVFVFMGIAGTQWFIAENLQKFMLWRSLSGAVINVILNLLLIPRLGIMGSAIATVSAQLMATFLFNALSRQTKPLFQMQLRALTFYKPSLVA